MTIVEFLEARLAEDEAAALTAGGSAADWLYVGENDQATNGEVVWSNSRRENTFHRGSVNESVYVTYDRYVTCDSEGLSPAVYEEDGPHIARHDPARALAEVAAKRGILEAHAGRSPRSSDFCRICEDPYTYGPEAWPCDTVRYLASIYKDHPDFNKHTEGGWTI